MRESTHRRNRRENTLSRALEKLQRCSFELKQVRRVAVGRQGAIHIEVTESGGQRFFVYRSDKLQELLPEEDTKIPLATRMADAEFSSNHRIISYRPGRRIVLGPASERQGHIIKGFKQHQAVLALERYRLAQTACEKGGFDVAELVQFDANNDFLAMAIRPGEPPMIETGKAGVWGDIGAHLKLFQQSGISRGLQDFNCQDELAVLDERGRRFLLCIPDLPEHWLAGVNQLKDVSGSLPATAKGLTHRDLHDRQFIVDGNKVSLLDFDLICVADVALDAGNLLVHMKLRTLQKPEAGDIFSLVACGQAFLSGLDRQDDPGFTPRLFFYQASSYFRLALLYALRPRWAHLTAELVSEGQRCVDVLSTRQGNS